MTHSGVIIVGLEQTLRTLNVVCWLDDHLVHKHLLREGDSDWPHFSYPSLIGFLDQCSGYGYYHDHTIFISFEWKMLELSNPLVMRLMEPTIFFLSLS